MITTLFIISTIALVISLGFNKLLYRELWELKQDVAFGKLFRHNLHTFKQSRQRLLDYTKKYKKISKKRGKRL